jgi:hypothetical protein
MLIFLTDFNHIIFSYIKHWTKTGFGHNKLIIFNTILIEFVLFEMIKNDYDD